MQNSTEVIETLDSQLRIVLEAAEQKKQPSLQKAESPNHAVHKTVAILQKDSDVLTESCPF